MSAHDPVIHPREGAHTDVPLRAVFRSTHLAKIRGRICSIEYLLVVTNTAVDFHALQNVTDLTYVSPFSTSDRPAGINFVLIRSPFRSPSSISRPARHPPSSVPKHESTRHFTGAPRSAICMTSPLVRSCPPLRTNSRSFFLAISTLLLSVADDVMNSYTSRIVLSHTPWSCQLWGL